MKIVFMGTPDFAVPSLQKLIEMGHDVEMVVTQPDKRGNRGRVTVSAVKAFAESNGLRVEQPFAIRRDEEFMSELEELCPDFIIVAAFGQILPKRVLDIPKLGCINVHGSLLPELRGAAPMQRAILDGLTETGVTIMRMDVGLDTGDMISKASVTIGDMDINELADRLAAMGAELLADTIPRIVDGTAEYVKQDDSVSTYAHMIKKTDGLTGFKGPADAEGRRIRAFLNWPNAYSYLNGKSVKFYDAEVLNDKADGMPGSICDISADGFSVNCGEGKLRIRELQLQGKKRMSAGDFLRGHALTEKDSFKEEV